MKYFVTILFILLSLITLSQSGGRMKERKNQKRLVHHIARSGWHYKKTPKFHRKESLSLYRWNITQGKKYKRKLLTKINRDRARKRVRGNLVFAKRKYKRV